MKTPSTFSVAKCRNLMNKALVHFLDILSENAGKYKSKWLDADIALVLFVCCILFALLTSFLTLLPIAATPLRSFEYADVKYE